jgi:hypothetical protein
MGSGSDVELAKFLADEAENGARPVKPGAAPSEWRWSSTGWDMQPRSQLPELDDAVAPAASKDADK